MTTARPAGASASGRPATAKGSEEPEAAIAAGALGPTPRTASEGTVPRLPSEAAHGAATGPASTGPAIPQAAPRPVTGPPPFRARGVALVLTGGEAEGEGAEHERAEDDWGEDKRERARAEAERAERARAETDRVQHAGAVAACVTAVLAALFGDWGSWSAPLGDGLPGFPLPWGVTAGPPVLLVSLAGVFVGWAGAPSFARTWAHTAAGLAAATGLLALLRGGWGPDAGWAALSEAAHAGLFGVLTGWVPALAAFAITRRRARRSTGLAPYVWTTGLAALAPLLFLGLGVLGASSDPPDGCSAAECITARAGLLFTGEVSLRIALPAWAASVAVLALARRRARIRNLRTGWQVLLALAGGGLAVLLAPGLIFGAEL
ncbi:hypothetical protein [Streptomyces sp. NPDC002082]|uniref:hypothetical protein n=1 Tax=Streptomyces sp. NPDC002082 TaxID=3154772 RepID=UPI003331087E